MAEGGATAVEGVVLERRGRALAMVRVKKADGSLRKMKRCDGGCFLKGESERRRVFLN